jgi:hypothetical protein
MTDTQFQEMMVELEGHGDLLSAHSVQLDYLLFFGLFGIGVLLLRIAVLGKNQRNLY